MQEQDYCPGPFSLDAIDFPVHLGTRWFIFRCTPIPFTRGSFPASLPVALHAFAHGPSPSRSVGRACVPGGAGTRWAVQAGAGSGRKRSWRALGKATVVGTIARAAGCPTGCFVGAGPGRWRGRAAPGDAALRHWRRRGAGREGRAVGGAFLS